MRSAGFDPQGLTGLRDEGPSDPESQTSPPPLLTTKYEDTREDCGRNVGLLLAVPAESRSPK